MRFLKRSAMIAVIIAAIVTSVKAEDWATDEGSAYTKGSSKVSVGLAIWPYGINAAYEYGFHQAISGSVYTGFMMYPDFITDYTFVAIPLYIRGAFHPFNLKVLQDKIPVRNKVDVYVGLATGGLFGFWTKPANSIYSEPNAPFPFQLREYIGVRYYFNEKFSVFAEECGGYPYMNAGICMNL